QQPAMGRSRIRDRAPSLRSCIDSFGVTLAQMTNARFLSQPRRYITCSAVCMPPRPFRYWYVCATLLFSAQAAHAASLTLAWDPNPEPNIAGYVIEYGNQPGVRPFSIDVGNQTTYQLNGLIDGMPYYFAVRAYDTFRMFSGPSIEVSRRVGVPLSVAGDF